ncbi:seryl-tRNA synthetase [Dyadobacter sp. BE34]|uniref:Serine--tRNA ligase n=1 Tax=Dyadobacter fermentans TaxID=94254 RepID=A0ABU1R7B1_9BACT|nr:MULTISPECIES: serine--tRNA ligase [Dyadobacter]MDR6809258.1 seryl-tRNA synthetase [Dyadobacter fermentans]MDR7047148.1 seryl-tRNA synthetase [Dyadobacter sp. BE242]MDR7194885.1 seryl-tRNA synthetase [Dyadobacter sp. BE34]MDR7214570.1 seryl-tRNA synthetase [Dyadobacter sp. BE31]MDR7266807.1 seryl-tRNA synthetase [Dyadobacter sp. BE32]
MLQTNFIRENRELTIAGLTKKHFKDAEQAVDRIIELDGKRRQIQQDLDDVLAASNNKAKEIGALMKTGQKAEAEAAKADTAALKERSKALEEEHKAFEESLLQELVKLPNLPHESVPEGRTADDNVTVLEAGVKPTLHEGALPHWDLIKKLGGNQAPIIDFELGNKIAGAGFPVYKGKAARLQRAMIAFFLSEAGNAGYTEVQPPIVVNADSGFATGQLPDKEGQMYHATVDDLYLIPTAEVPVTNLYRDVIVAESELPVKNVAFTPCFRREAGSWGAHVRGLNRLHQFDKVEIVQINKPEDSYKALDEMVEHVKSLLEKLELPYRILRLCGGDMGFTSALTYDFEVWSAGQQRWLECSSVSNFETYQANRLKLRYKNADKKTQLLHTLNGSALALPRILAALLENNQLPDGTVKVPAVLVPFCGFDVIE